MADDDKNKKSAAPDAKTDPAAAAADATAPSNDEKALKEAADKANENQKEARKKKSGTGTNMMNWLLGGGLVVGLLSMIFGGTGFGLLGVLLAGGAVAGDLMNGDKSMIAGVFNKVTGMFGGKKETPTAEGPSVAGTKAPEKDVPDAEVKFGGKVVVVKDGKPIGADPNDKKTSFGTASDVTFAEKNGALVVDEITGKVNDEKTHFIVTSMNNALPGGGRVVPATAVKRDPPVSLTIASDGTIDFKSPALNDLRKDAALAAQQYSAPKSLDIVEIAGTSDKVRADLGKTASANYTVVLEGTAKDNKVTAVKGLLKDRNGKIVSREDGSPIAVNINDAEYVIRDKKITLMNGDVPALIGGVVGEITALKEQDTKAAVAAKIAEQKAITESVESQKDAPSAIAALQNALREKLTKAGVGKVAASLVATEISQQYLVPDFRNAEPAKAANSIKELPSVKGLPEATLNLLKTDIEAIHKQVGASVAKKPLTPDARVANVEMPANGLTPGVTPAGAPNLDARTVS